MPVVLYAVAACLMVDRSQPLGGRRAEVFLAAAVASLLLAGHPETILYAGFFIGAFAVFLLFRQRSDGFPLGRGISKLVVPTLVAAAITAPILVPTAQYLPHTWRVATLGESGAVPSLAPKTDDSLHVAAKESGLVDLQRAWVPLAAPNTFGNSRYVHYWGARNSNEASSGFTGTIPLLAAFLGVCLVAGGQRRPVPGERLAQGTVVFVLGILGLSAFRSDLLPSALHGGGRLRMLFAFSVAFLAACALERFQRGQSGLDSLRPSLLGVAVVGVGLTFVGFHSYAYSALSSPQGLDVLRDLRFGWLHWHLRFLVIGVFLFTFARRRRWMPWAVAILVAAELLLVFRDANPPMPRELAFPTPPALEVALKLEDEPRLVGLGSALPPNLAAVYGIGDARIYNPVEPALYATLVEPLLEKPRGNVPRAVVADHPLYDLLGIGFLLTEPEVELPLEIVVDDASGRLYRRPRPLDVLFLPNGVVSVEEASWPSAVHRAGDVHESSLVIEEGKKSLAWQAELPLESSLHQVKQEGPRVSARGTLLEQRLLASRLLAVGSESGWRLVSNGTPRATVRANGPLVAAWLPAGDHDLNLLYRPSGFFLGCVLAALGASLAFLRWWSAPRFSEAIESKNE